MNSLTQPSGQSLYKFAFIASHVSLHRDMGSVLEPLASLTERATEPTSGTARQQNSLQGRSLLLEPLALREALSVRAQEPRGGAGKHPPPPPPGVPALSIGVGSQPSEPATHHVPAAKGRITSRSHSPPTAYAGGVHLVPGFYPGRAGTACWLLPGSSALRPQGWRAGPPPRVIT